MESLDDAGVYKLTEELAIIQTVDFFTPIVDDPYAFGQIAVANALSDVYTMGGRPLTALNIVCFPSKSLDISVLKAILKGGVDKMREAGVILLGGHSVDDAELKYGLAVTGMVHPNRLITNSGAKPGDKLVLTKPLGTGIISTAIKAGEADNRTTAKVVRSMAALNKHACEVMQEIGVHACTDITGFGFIGHACQLAQNSHVGLMIDAVNVPVFEEVRDFINKGLCPGGLYRNRDFYGSKVEFGRNVPEYLKDVLFDPQTSGGLLIALAAESAVALLGRLSELGVKEAAIVGEVIEEPEGRMLVS
jgi:selenide,water dikinase